jgi:hypothetical protein
VLTLGGQAGRLLGLDPNGTLLRRSVLTSKPTD